MKGYNGFIMKLADHRVTRARPDLLDEIDVQLHPIFRKYDVLQAVAFGSLATGDASRRSDLDLIIIQNTSKRFLDRYTGILQELSSAVTDRDVDLLIYTPQELTQLAERPFLQQALREGTIIYESQQESAAG